MSRETHRVDPADIESNVGNIEQNKTKHNFATRLNALLADNGISQREVCQETGIASGSLSKYRNGKQDASIANANLLSKYLSVSVDYLIDNTDVKNPNIEARQICEYTGLSEETISTLRSIKHQYSNDNAINLFKILNGMFGNPVFYKMLNLISEYGKTKNGVIKYHDRETADLISDVEKN